MYTNILKYGENTRFLRYQNGIAYYAVSVPYSEMLYSFPVPLKDIESEGLMAEEKSASLTKFIRKAIYEGTLNKII